jgi:NADH:ubiquinone oxidoreductase subunit 6 (subunit J)
MLQIEPWMLDLFEYVEFFLVTGIVLVLAWLALEHKDIVYAVFFFGLMASFVAGFFLLLDAPYIAGMQIAVYTGGISALIIFGVLLLPRAQDSTLEVFESPRARKIGFALSFVTMVFSAGLALLFPWPQSIPEGSPETSQSLAGLANWLWNEHGVYLQIIALIMLTTLVGSVAILRMEKAESLFSIKGEFGVEAAPEATEDVEQPVETPEEVDTE